MNKEEMMKAFKIGTYIRCKDWIPSVACKLLAFYKDKFMAEMNSGFSVFIQYGNEFEECMKDGRKK